MSFIVLVPVDGGWDYLKDRTDDGVEVAMEFETIEDAEKMGEPWGVFEIMEVQEDESKDD